MFSINGNTIKITRGDTGVFTLTIKDGDTDYDYSNVTAANNIFYSCSALTEIHFAAANQSAIEASTGYSTKWGRSAATVYFDL